LALGLEAGREVEPPEAPAKRGRFHRTNGDVIIVHPKSDLIARLDPELISEPLRDHHLSLRADAMSHAAKYDPSSEIASGVIHDLAHRRHDLVVKAPVGGDDASVDIEEAPVGEVERGAVDVGHPSAGLLDDELAGGVMPPRPRWRRLLRNTRQNTSSSESPTSTPSTLRSPWR
jgi:hypothetical protein